ncbi:SRPBCC family protein [Sphingomonas sp. G-3-2-10]|uniref:SRPBCC family protein n=1 Tax=Sphingomonas sp. G-3-2-10 TaxID=2728838 RepID=UPI00146D3C6C|nr:SRPBCC family protein [Sphingomonas sp. G-3-2-10]NML08315.1 SRPBCC family protein [Sphingomonas sp. G-3-2-10]
MSNELVIERLMDAPVSALWRAYTDHLGEWFCPPPWRAELVEMDLRAGGRSSVTMYGPNGEEMPNEGVYLEVIPDRLIVFTDAFTPGWNPAGQPFMVGSFEFEPQGDKTLFRGRARHWTEEARSQHEAMGFEQGWGVMAAQWEAVAKRLAAG